MREERVWLSRIETRRRQIGSEERVAEMFPTAEGAAARHPPEHLASAVPWMSISPVWGRFLMRLVRELRPGFCLELGTGFGISAAYQGAALALNDSGRLITLDFPTDWSAIAERGFVELGLAGRVELRRGPIDETLASALEDAAPVGCAFLDAEHNEEATVRHFDALLPGLAPGAVVVIDDVGWNDGMRRAWGRIRGQDRVAWSVALGRMGAIVIS